MYIIRNLNKLDRIPDELRESIFERLFEVAEIAKFSKLEAESYEDSMKIYRDLNNSINTAREEGELVGILKGKLENNISLAETMMNENESIEKIIKYTGLTENQIQEIISRLKK